MRDKAKQTYNFLKEHILGAILILTILLGTISAGITIARSFITGTDIALGQFAFFHFAAYIFFIISSAEMFYIKAIITGHPTTTIFLLAIATALIAQAINYAIGYFFSEKIIKYTVGEKKLESARNKIEGYGNPVIFVFNLFPLSSPLLSFTAGMIKYTYWKLLVFSAAGLTLKYATITLAFSAY